MKTKMTLLIALLGFLYSPLMAQNGGYSIGDSADDFNLTSVDGSEVSLSKLENAKGAIVIFSCNTCPYVVAYEDRIIDLHKKYASKGYPVIAINSNDAKLSPGDSFEAMKKRANEKNFPFAYVHDHSQEVIKNYGGTRTPHVYLLNKENGKFIVKYIGAIDNNYQNPAAVTERYVEDALDAVMNGRKIALETTKAIGCTIKWKKNSQ